MAGVGVSDLTVRRPLFIKKRDWNLNNPGERRKQTDTPKSSKKEDVIKCHHLPFSHLFITVTI